MSFSSCLFCYLIKKSYILSHYEFLAVLDVNAGFQRSGHTPAGEICYPTTDSNLQRTK